MGHLAHAVLLVARSLVLVDRGFFVAALASTLESRPIAAAFRRGHRLSATAGLLASVFLPRLFRSVPLFSGGYFFSLGSFARSLDQSYRHDQV